MDIKLKKKHKFHTKDVSLPDFYNLYITKAAKREREYVPYKLFTAVLRDFNLNLRDKIVLGAERAILPYKLGELYIKKFNVDYDLDNMKSWKIDYKATKDTGTLIYHTNMVGYRWKWSKAGMRLRGKKYYNYKPCRQASRMVSDAIKNKKLDYYN